MKWCFETLSELWSLCSVQQLKHAFYPMKLTTTKCRITWARMKSAKPRSGEIPTNCCLFSGFTCKRRHTRLRNKWHEPNICEWICLNFLNSDQFSLPPSTKQLTVEMNPDKNELNGNVPTKQQYKNCMTPVSTM